MNCKKCGNLINLTIADSPIDICWDCISKNNKDIVLENNINAKRTNETNNIRNSK